MSHNKTSFDTYNENINNLTSELLLEYGAHVVSQLSIKGITRLDLVKCLESFSKHKKVPRPFLSRDIIYRVTDYTPTTQLLLGLKTKTLISEFKALNARPSNVKGYRIEHDKMTKYGDGWIINDLTVLEALDNVISHWNLTLKEVTRAQYEKEIALEQKKFFETRFTNKKSKKYNQEKYEDDYVDEETNGDDE